MSWSNSLFLVRTIASLRFYSHRVPVRSGNMVPFQDTFRADYLWTSAEDVNFDKMEMKELSGRERTHESSRPTLSW